MPSAYREALKKRTQERGPLQWAATQKKSRKMPGFLEHTAENAGHVQNSRILHKTQPVEAKGLFLCGNHVQKSALEIPYSFMLSYEDRDTKR